MPKKMSDHMRHQSKCDGTIKYVFPGDVYKNKLSVFEELEEMGVRVHCSALHCQKCWKVSMHQN